LEGIEFKGDAVPHLKGPNNIDLVPEVRRTPGNTAIALHDQDLPPGPYAVVSGNDTLMTLALDLPRRESDLSAYSVDELKALLTEKGLTSYTVLDTGTSDLSLKLNELDQGRKLWKWFILIALLFLAAEVFLIRYLK